MDGEKGLALAEKKIQSKANFGAAFFIHRKHPGGVRLGAWGCGAFGSNAKMASSLFYAETEANLDKICSCLFAGHGGRHPGHMRGVQGPPHGYVHNAWLDWMRTQNISFAESRKARGHTYSWLCDVPQLYSRRAPGMTCTGALRGNADDVCHGCQMGEYSPYHDPDRERKYIYMRRKEGPANDD